MHPEPALAELGLLADLTINTVLFGGCWGRKPLIVAGQFQFGAVFRVRAFDGWPKRGGGVGDGIVGPAVEGGVGH